MTNLWDANTPDQFWLCEPNPPDELWEIAIQQALPELGLTPPPSDVGELLRLTLGEEQFGPNRWKLSTTNNFYYKVKPLVPSALKQAIRRFFSTRTRESSRLGWPIEPRYAEFQWEVIRQLLIITGCESLSFRYFWPDGGRFAFVLTHDVETADGQRYVRNIADLEEKLGFRSAFAFVPERYALDYDLIAELQERGFEIGVHGLKHDGKDFQSYSEFSRRATRINHYLKRFDTKGFYAPLTIRQPEWMQMLDIDYDRSFFDTDPFEPNPGGVMSIWPFTIGRFVELPYTMVQDHTLAILLQEPDTRLWQEKINFIKRYHGMALMVTHPDYLRYSHIEKLYVHFLNKMKESGDYWFALPRDVARWWRERSEATTKNYLVAKAVLKNEQLNIYLDL